MLKEHQVTLSNAGVECEAFYSGSGTVKVQCSLEDNQLSMFPFLSYYATHIHRAAGHQRRRHIKSAPCLNHKHL